MDCTFSDRRWPLGKIEQPLPLNILLYRYFAQFFLDGSVCPRLASFTDKLLLSPSAMTKSWAKCTVEHVYWISGKAGANFCWTNISSGFRTSCMKAFK
ncbi:unnamed protein product [Gongylonema pulchrum]|uniref:Uncharacterized protein n=1 Tax=Gongylonema pulchrum TaxID=637853 RepID=A0A183EKI4_9BILA|nr:unnamed protein product [Gongylonema pulchrum]